MGTKHFVLYEEKPFNGKITIAMRLYGYKKSKWHPYRHHRTDIVTTHLDKVITNRHPRLPFAVFVSVWPALVRAADAGAAAASGLRRPARATHEGRVTPPGQ